MSAPPMPLSGEATRDEMQRERFCEEAIITAQKMVDRAFKQLDDARNALERERARLADVELEAAEWRALAFKHGIRTEAERRSDTDTLNGRVTIAADVVARGGQDAILHACMDLAKKLSRSLPSGVSPDA